MRSRPLPDLSAVAPDEVAAFVAALALDLEAMAERARLVGVAACLRGAVVEARRLQTIAPPAGPGGKPAVRPARKPARPAA
jgi:hypothetical protein